MIPIIARRTNRGAGDHEHDYDQEHDLAGPDLTNDLAGSAETCNVKSA